MRFALILVAAVATFGQEVPSPAAAPVPVPVEAPVPTAAPVPVPVTAPVPVPVAAPVPAAPNAPKAPVPMAPAPMAPMAPVPMAPMAPAVVPATAALDAAVNAALGNGTTNVSAFNTLLAGVNSQGALAPAATSAMIADFAAKKAGMVHGSMCYNCEAGTRTGTSGQPIPLGCLVACTGATTRAANNGDLILLGNGPEAIQRANLHDAVCAGYVSTGDICYINGQIITCPSCKSSGSKKGLLGLLGLIGIVPLVLSCSLLFLLCRGKKQPVPVATFVPMEQSTCMPMPVHCDAGLTYNNGCAPTAFGFGQAPVML